FHRITKAIVEADLLLSRRLDCGLVSPISDLGELLFRVRILSAIARGRLEHSQNFLGGRYRPDIVGIIDRYCQSNSADQNHAVALVDEVAEIRLGRECEGSLPPLLQRDRNRVLVDEEEIVAVGGYELSLAISRERDVPGVLGREACCASRRQRSTASAFSASTMEAPGEVSWPCGI